LRVSSSRPPHLRARFGRAGALILAALATSCDPAIESGPAGATTGEIALSLSVANGVVINSVGYQLTGNGIIPLGGMINVSDPGASASLFISSIPAGTGYLIELTARSTDGGTTCEGRASFDVVASATSMVQLLLNCTAPPSTGTVVIGGTVNSCPVIGMVSVSPLVVGLGGSINLQAAASDADPGALLEYFWTTTGNGTFVNSRAPSTRFVCATAGNATLRLTVTDGDCPKFIEVPIACSALAAGGL
jgi:hypothetical protein